MLDIWLDSIQSLLYPPVCLLCGAPGADSLDLCSGCRVSLPRVVNPCPGCGVSLPTTAAGPCGRCQHHPPRFDSIVVPYQYRTPVDWLIQRLKFQGRLAHARLLGELLARAVEAVEIVPPELVLSVPLHSGRLRERGFNQAAEIARYAARRLGLRHDARCIERPKATTAQMGLPAKQRRANVRGAFAVREPARVAGRHVAVLDDVVTTGSTVEEIARVLKRAGALRVAVWACARA